MVLRNLTNVQIPSANQMELGYLKYKQSLNRTSTNTFRDLRRFSKKIPKNLSQKRTPKSSTSTKKLLLKQKSASPQFQKQSTRHLQKSPALKSRAVPESTSIRKILSLNRLSRRPPQNMVRDSEKRRPVNSRLSLRKMIRRGRSSEKLNSSRSKNLPYNMIRKLGKGSYACVYLGRRLVFANSQRVRRFRRSTLLRPLDPSSSFRRNRRRPSTTRVARAAWAGSGKKCRLNWR